VRLEGDRAMICEGVLVRAGANGRLEMHVDTDEANAAGLPAESIGRILVPVMDV
jgi:propanediol utilization protein